jgi:hypothetical protein
MSNINLNHAYHQEIKAVRSMKERGVIEDYKGNEAVGVVWVKAEGEWLEVWNWTEAIESHTDYNNA